jgi:hypothetical protein
MWTLRTASIHPAPAQAAAMPDVAHALSRFGKHTILRA